MLFRSGMEPDAGIPLTPDLVSEYERIAKEPPLRGPSSAIKKAFLFREADAEKFFTSERLSAELLALGEHMTSGNPLRKRVFLEEDEPWSGMAYAEQT